jgi:NADH-quinone oxidoreductase subunit N
VDLALTAWQLSPELVLLVAGLVIMLVDALRPRESDSGWAPYAALAGLAAALVASVSLLGREPDVVLGVLAVDGLSLVAKMLALVAVAIVVLFSGPFMKERASRRGEFYSLLLFATLAISILTGASDIVLVFLGLDFLSIASYVLTGYVRESKRSSEAAIKYFLYGATLSAVMLYGLSLLYGLTGSTSLDGVAAGLAGGSVGNGMILAVLVLVMAGLGFKIAAVPFHQWAPDAYEGASTPVTAFLSLGPKVAGFSVLARFLYFAFPGEVQTNWVALLFALSAVTMTVGNLTAIWQRNIKRLLAYSSIAQAGYLMIGVASLSTGGLVPLLFYLGAYLFANLGAFAVVVAMSRGRSGEDIGDYAGLAQRSPGLALAMLLFLLSLAGIPPLAGFVGKVGLFLSAVDRGLIGLVVIAVVNSVISLYYYLQVVRQMYLLDPQRDEDVAVARPVRATVLVSVVGVVLLGIVPMLLLPLIEQAAGAIIPGS